MPSNNTVQCPANCAIHVSRERGEYATVLEKTRSLKKRNPLARYLRNSASRCKKTKYV